MFAYCGNNPANRADPTGQIYDDLFFGNVKKPKSSDYKIVGAGIQLDASIGSGHGGAEVIVYWGTKEAKDNGGPVVAVYGYGGVAINDMAEEVNSIVDLLLNNIELLKLDGASVLQTLLAGFSFKALKTIELSASGILVWGNDFFENTKDYEGWFVTTSFNIFRLTGSYSVGKDCRTVTVGGSFAPGIGGFGWHVNTSYYFQIRI